MNRLVVQWRELRRQLRPTGCNLRRIEELIRVARRLPQDVQECRRKVDLGDFGGDGSRKPLREDGAEDRRAHGPADVTPELDLTGTDAEASLRQATLGPL